MKKRQNNSARASALQITLAAGLMSIAAILLASSFRAAPAGNEETQFVAQEEQFASAPEQDVDAPAVIGTCDTAGPIEVEATAGTLGPTAYATLQNAFAAITAGNHQGVINVEVCGDTTETATASLDASGTGAASYTSVTVRPVGAARIIEGTITGAIIKLNGADNVTIDGRIGGAGTNRDLTVRNNSTSTATAAIWLSSVAAGNGATNDIIRNLEIAGGVNQVSSTSISFGIIQTGTTISATTGGNDNDNNSFIANRIIRARYGICSRGVAGNPNINPVVTDNIIGPAAFGPDQIGKAGIYMSLDTGAQISRNTVQNVGGLFADTASGTDRLGIAIGSDSWGPTESTVTEGGNYSVTKNVIHDVVEEKTFSSVGIRVGTTRSGSPTLNLVTNNFVYNIRANATSPDQVCGIGWAGGVNDIIAFNSISITGDQDPGASTSSTIYGNGLRISTANGANNANLTMKNNSIYLDVNSNNATTHYYAITAPSAAYSFGSGALDNNNYYINAVNAQLRTGGLSTTTGATTTTEFATLANWQTAFTVPQDANSKQADPLYVSNTSDLHITPVTSPNIDMAMTVTGVIDDIDGNGRPNGPASDIGADEIAGAPVATPTPSSTPTATSTASATATATATVPPTPTPSPTPCLNYTSTLLSGSIVPGTLDIGNHTDDASTLISLPFNYQLYESTFSSVRAGSNGHLSFGVANEAFNPGCAPNATATYVIWPYWTDQCTNVGASQCVNNNGTTYGIFTSTSGTAPNRIFNIEWRTAYYNSADTALNYEVRLYEGQTQFDIIYGTVPPTFTPPSARTTSIGVQRTNTTGFTLLPCDTTGGQMPAVSSGQLYRYNLGIVCPSPTATATATSTVAPTATPATVCTLTEGFDVIANLGLAGWTMQNNSFPGGLTGWFQGNSDVFPAHTGAPTSYIGANFNNTTGTNTISNWLLTPPVTVQNGAKFGFFTRTTTPGTTVFPDRLQVRMSTNGTSGNVGSSPTDVGDFTNLLLDINPTYTSTGYPSTWTYYFVTVSGVGSPTKGRMAFRYFVESGGTTGANSDYIGIDQAMYDCTGNLATPSPTATFTPSATATITATATATATASASPTPTATFTPIVTPTPPCGSPTTVLSQNFDGVVAPALPVGWVASNAAGTDGILWVTSNSGSPTPSADSPPNSAFVNDPNSVHDKLLDSPTIAINGPAQLSFRNYYNTETSTTPGLGYDGGVLEIKIGAGAFTDIQTAGGAFITNGYNATISTQFSSPLVGRQAWSGNSGGFVTTTVNLPPAANGQNIVLRWRMGSDNSISAQGWRIDDVALLDCLPSNFSISGTVGQCNTTGPSGILLDGVTVAYAGASSGSTVTAGGGLYTLSGLVGGNYTVTPSKANRPPGSAGINTTDVIAIQRHFLILGTPLTGCRLLAADCAAPVGITTGDVIAAQRYFLVLSTGIGNVGRYSFTPTTRTYTPLGSNQTAQDYSAIVFGDVATPFANPRPGGPPGDAPEVAPPSLASVAAIELPSVSVDQSRSYFSLPVRTTRIDAQSNLVGFQGDLTFDERVVTFQNEPVRAAGLTANNWNVSANVIPGNGPIRTLRISAYSNTFAPLSGSGTLFELNMTRVSKGAVGTRLTWAPAPDQFIFIDADLNTRTVGNVAPGGVNLTVQR